MTGSDRRGGRYTLLAFERLTDHGFALPLFGTSASANALHVAVPSTPGDGDATIVAFEIYETEDAVALDDGQVRVVGTGELWIDVFLWSDFVYVGQRRDIWSATADVRSDIQTTAPLTLLALASDMPDAIVTSAALRAHAWLAEEWGAGFADRWRTDSYLPDLALRDLRRRSGRNGPALSVRDVRVFDRGEAVEIVVSGSVGPGLVVEDLSRTAAAAAGFGWKVFVTTAASSHLGDGATGNVEAEGQTMLMRLRHGRGRTQTQIPFAAADRFFENDRTIYDVETGRSRAMTLSRAGGRRNTMKLQLPGMENMVDPVISFRRAAGRTTYELHDSSSPRGAEIAAELQAGLHDASTRTTPGRATWWRLLPSDGRRGR